MKLMIIRHGDPDYSIDSLTPRGWQEAALLSQRLEKLEIQAFYCSPLGRARDTASLTLKALNRDAQILPWLREFAPKVAKPNRDDSCAWDWLPQDWTAEPRFYDKNRWTEPQLFRDADIASEAQWVAEGVDTLLSRHGYVREGNYYRAECPNEDTVALFCHFGVECVILGHLLGISPMPLWHGTCAAPSSVTILTTEERRRGIAAFRMNTFGDTSHLYAGGMDPAFAARFCETYDNMDQRHD